MEVNETLTPLQRFWRLLKPDMPEIRNIYAYAIFSGLISLSLPLGIQAIVNLIQGGEVNTAWIVLVIFVVLGVAATGVLQILQLRITENIQQKIFTRSAFELAYRIPNIRLEKLYNHYAPELMNRFFDTITVQKSLSKILIDFSTASFNVIFGLILLSIYHPFFIFFSLLLLLTAYVIIRYSASSGLRTSLQESKHKYRVAHWLEEVARTSVTFKLSGTSDLSLKKVDGRVSDYLEARESHFRILVRQFGHLVFFKVLVATGLLAIGGVLVMDERMNIGQFVAAEIIVLLVMSSIEKIIVSMETIYDMLTSLEKIGYVTDLELERVSPENPIKRHSNSGMSVELQDVSFAYPDAKQHAIREISTQIDSRDRVVILGGSGSGKSSLLHVIAGLYEAQNGNLLYDGVPVNSLDLEELRTEIGDCLSEELIFEGTILENITMGRPAATMDNVEWAVRSVGLSDFIKSLPEGYNTMLKPLGKTLVRGTVQQILIARAIVERPRLLLLEHTFANLAPETCNSIIDFLTSDENEWTLVAVTKDPYFVAKSTKVIVLDEGKAAFQGTYKQYQNTLKGK